MRGTVRERRPGVWHVQVKHRVDGAVRYTTRTVHGTASDADLVRAQLVADLEAQRQPVSTDTVGAWVAEWIDANEARGRWRASTAKKHRENLDRLGSLHGVKLARLRPVDVDRLYASLARKYAPAVVRGVHATLRGALRDAARLGLIHSVPTEGARLPAMRQQEQEAPTTERVHAVLAHVADDPMWHAWFRLAASTGARPAEVCGLRWGDISIASEPRSHLNSGNANSSVVTIRSAARLVDSKSWRIEAEAGTKTDRPRTVTIDPGAVEALAAWRRQRVELHLRHGARLGPRTLVFPLQRRPDVDLPLTPGACSQRWRHVWSLIGDGRTVPLYGLRHWHASALLRAGVPVAEVARRLGHASAKMTLDVYGHHITDDSDTASAAVARLLRGAAP